MKKWKRIVLVCLLPLLLITIFFFESLLRVSSEKNVEHYLSSLPTDGLVKIGLYGLGEHVELFSAEAQREILDHLSKLKANMGAEGSDTRADGAVVFCIRLDYRDGRQETISYPAFSYPTILGKRGFYLSVEGDIWAPFRQYFRLLQD